jgi:hypothetical protein
MEVAAEAQHRNPKAKLGVNDFADLDPKEYRQRFGPRETDGATTVDLPAKHRAAFDAFKVDYGRTYAGPEEEARRFSYFIRNMEVAAEAQRRNPKAKFGINDFADLAPEEFRQRLGFRTTLALPADETDASALSGRYRAAFDEFKTAHNRAYENAEEEARRFSYFIRNMEVAAEMQRRNPVAKFGANSLADLSPEEFRQRLGVRAATAKAILDSGVGASGAEKVAIGVRRAVLAAARNPAANNGKGIPYEERELVIFDKLLKDERYQELGQIALGEEPLTVGPNAFTQMGIVEPAGVRDMLRRVITPELTARDVFCDVGSGTGNICLQVLADSPAGVVGIELLPSRHEHALLGLQRAQAAYPDVYRPERTAAFVVGEVTKVGESALRDNKVSVLFSHSWMFDDALMRDFERTIINATKPKGAVAPADGAVVEGAPLRMVISSRAMPLLPEETQLKCYEQTTLQADWNPASPFHVYKTC